MANKFELGKVYAHNYGYSICAYEFFKCIRATDKSAWLQELGKRWVSGDGQQGMVVCTYEPLEDRPIKMVRQGTYMGTEYDGRELYEDHMD